MNQEIVIDRGSGPGVLKLDEDEEALMNEISIEQPRMRRPPRPTPRERGPPQPTAGTSGLEAFANPLKQAPPTHVEAPTAAQEDYDDDEYDDYDDDEYDAPEDEQPSAGFKNVDEERADLLNKLKRLESKGFSVNKRLNAYSSVDDLRNEVKRITYSIDVDQSVKFSRRALIACVTGLEFLNKRYNPFEMQLDGWSESVHESIDDFDPVFEELYAKYNKSMHVSPELKLILMLGGSAFMFHLSNSMFKGLPDMGQVLKNNPDLMKNMMSAAAQHQQTQGGGATNADGQYEMAGPGFDISSLMGGMMPPPPMNTSREEVRVEDADDDISDIVSAAEEDEEDEEETREVSIPQKKPTKKKSTGGRKKKVEINL